MPPPHAPADSDAQTHQAGHSSTAAHYVETIFYIRFEEGPVRPGRLAAWLGVSPPSVTVALQRLARDGWIVTAPDRSVSLTARGEELAARIVRAHRLMERWLTDVLGLDWAAADQEAQFLAGGVSEQVADRLDELLGRPATCPHGNVIPGRDAPYQALVALADLAPGVLARVRRISEVAEHDAPELLRELNGYGLVTGAQIRLAPVHRSVGALPVEVGGRTRPIGIAVARLIWVEPEPPALPGR
jgi:DtxR family Mn-dependent transcriptional regulator